MPPTRRLTSHDSETQIHAIRLQIPGYQQTHHRPDCRRLHLPSAHGIRTPSADHHHRTCLHAALAACSITSPLLAGLRATPANPSDKRSLQKQRQKALQALKTENTSLCTTSTRKRRLQAFCAVVSHPQQPLAILSRPIHSPKEFAMTASTDPRKQQIDHIQKRSKLLLETLLGIDKALDNSL